MKKKSFQSLMKKYEMINILTSNHDDVKDQYFSVSTNLWEQGRSIS